MRHLKAHRLFELLKIKLALTLVGRDDPKWCNQIKRMRFIQTCLPQSESASPKDTALYVYNMSLFLVVCVLNRWQKALRQVVQDTYKQRPDTWPHRGKGDFELLEVSLSRHLRCHFSGDQGEVALSTVSALLQDSLSRLIQIITA